MTTARQVAVDVLNRSRSRDGFASELIDDALGAAQLSPQDRRFVTQLVFGTIRRSGTLDACVKPFIRIPLHAVQPRVWDVLRLGAFQIAFLTHVPRHAAVNETVDLVDYVGATKAKGFVNSVMRRVAELVTDEFTDQAGPDAVPFESVAAPAEPREPAPKPSKKQRDSTPAEAPAPVQQKARYRKLARPVLPDPATDAAAHFAAAFSFPQWLANRWLERYGPDECARLGFWFNAPPPLWVRVNKLHLDRETYRLLLAAKLIDAEPGEHPQSLRFTEHHSVRDLPGYADGDFAVQDHSSMLVASALGVHPKMHVLDLCAAPGGKTTHLAELMDNRGRITACDIDAGRLETVTALCERLHVKGIETVLVKEDGEPPAGPFDAALVDVPCSNTGVLGRRPEVRWRLKPNEFEHLVRLQTRLLIEAMVRVKPGCAVVYSTCSIEPEENEGVVKAVCKGMRGVVLEAEHHAVPGRPSDGGYWARLRKAK
jgi:16S rRNA (cytosine967-C5)-methyltransferase